VIYYVISAVVSMLSETFSLNFGTNIFIFHLYSIAELIILGKVFMFLLRPIKFRLNFNLLFWFILLLTILNSLFVQGLDEFNSISATIISLFVISMSIIYFNHSLNNPQPTKEDICVKWLVIAIFLYHSVSLIVFMFSNFMFAKDDILIWNVRAILVVLTKVVVLVSVLKLIYFNKIQKTI